MASNGPLDLKLVVKATVPVEVEIPLHGIASSTSITHVLGKVKQQALQHISQAILGDKKELGIVGPPKLEVVIPPETMEAIGLKPEPEGERSLHLPGPNP